MLHTFTLSNINYSLKKLSTMFTTNQLPNAYSTNQFPQTQSGYRTIKVEVKPYGFRVIRFSNYISLQYIKVECLPNGFSKATVKVDTNYRAKYQYTIYFDNNGNEIHSENNCTKAERKAWLQLQTS